MLLVFSKQSAVNSDTKLIEQSECREITRPLDGQPASL